MADALILIQTPVEHVENNYETARWYRSHKSDTGSFEMSLKLGDDIHKACFVAELPSTITSADLSSGFGGVAYSNAAGEREVGTRSSFTKSVCLFDAFTGRDGVKCIANTAIKKAMQFCDQQVIALTATLDRAMKGEIGGEAAKEIDSTVAFWMKRLSEAYELRSLVATYRDKKLAFVRGRIAHRHGGRNPYDRTRQYGEYTACHDGQNFQRKRDRRSA